MSADFSKAKWRKSSSSDSGGCVEVAYAEGVIGVRDTKQAGTGPMLTFTEREWSAFLDGAALGEFTLDELKR
ncbi:DUF397 domain-containing protein [Micromonospora sp. NPDC049836]|uniref:DUF397 domain-containing protein n=1 Tax=Micromonospora sp. NPDC049836 TaxID=3364274 RepID=UPI0037A74D2B